MSIRFTGENISNLDENHKKYPKSPVKVNVIKFHERYK